MISVKITGEKCLTYKDMVMLPLLVKELPMKHLLSVTYLNIPAMVLSTLSQTTKLVSQLNQLMVALSLMPQI